ncbi:hypothetical protein AA309_27105 [Microvirga vignae]|uniref:Uncharacterized protein n=1 Tax=Microvirga vignae TaxID=1225564 RepID=A0A0H1R5T0_9HYPH|nr:hypothetical protein AA309_27105 [Microvirga vignae]
MPIARDVASLDHIIEFAHEITDARPSCAGMASDIVTWSNAIRGPGPRHEELTALVDATCPGRSEKREHSSSTVCVPSSTSPKADLAPPRSKRRS